MVSLRRNVYIISIVFLFSAIWSGFFLNINIEPQATPTLVNGLTTSLSIIVGFTGTIAGLFFREEKNKRKGKIFFAAAIVIVMVPIGTLWGTYIYLAQGVDMYQFAVKSALSGLSTAMFGFTFVVIYGLTNFANDEENRKKKKANKKVEPSHDEIRHSILSALYKKAESTPNDSELTRGNLIDALGVADNLIDFNVNYLEQEQLLKITRRVPNIPWILAKITSDGINVIEHEEENRNHYSFLSASILPIHIETKIGLVNT